MPEKGCEQCKVLLDEAAAAISAHAKAVARLADAVGVNPSGVLTKLETEVHSTSLAREAAVLQYETHISAHELKIMTAGSGGTIE